MRTLLRALGTTSLAGLLAVGASADTIYMKNGSVIRGTVVGFGNGEFTVQLAGGSRSRATLAGDEIDHIQFESTQGNQGGGGTASAPPIRNGGQYDGGGTDPNDAGGAPPDDSYPSNPGPRSGSAPQPTAGQGGVAPGGGMDAGAIDVTVDPKADWTNSKFRVARGSRVRITATGQVKLDPTGKRVAGPGGVEAPDRDKLMPNRPTGALIAVVGDDNDDFVFVGSQAEFVASRAGYLFLSVNEGNLKDNAGSFVAHVVVEPPSGPPMTARTGGGMNGGRAAATPGPARRTDLPAPVNARNTRPDPDPYPSSSTPPDDSAAQPVDSTPADPAPVSSAGATVAREGDVVVQSNLDWTNTKIRVQRGNVVRVRANGTVQLGPAGRSGPGGVDAPDKDKLIPNRPTGALIAVVGDDNDDFMFVGPESEFVANHDGVLFLSVNEGNLKDNVGTYAAHVTILQQQGTASAAPAGVAPSTGASTGRAPVSTSPSGPRNGGGSSPLPTPVVDDAMGGQTPAAAAPRPVPAAIGENGGTVDIVVPAKSDWTSTGIVLKKGTKVRITASGSAKLDAAGRTPSTPAGVATADPHKLLKDKPTGGLVAVIGDDSGDYIFVGTATEFTASRDGLLFLGINEGELFDNSGTYAVRIVVEPARKR